MNAGPQTYELRIHGHLDLHWATPLRADSLVHTEDGDTTVVTTPLDQAELHGLLARLRDMGAQLVLLREQ